MTRPRLVSDEQILEAAREAFIEQGHTVSTTVIAERAGISQAVLFQRFGTKEKLMHEALMPSASLPWADKAKAGPDNREIKVQLRELAEVIAHHFETMLPAMLVLKSAGFHEFHLGADGETPVPIQGHQHLTSWFRTALDQGRIASIDPATVAVAFAGSLHTWAFLGHISNARMAIGDRGRYLDELIEFFWQGLQPREAS